MNTQIRITDLQLPPPAALGELSTMQFLLDSYRIPLFVETPHVQSICLLNYPTGFIEQLPHWIHFKIYRVPYYGKAIELGLVARRPIHHLLYRDSKKYHPFIFRRGDNHFSQLKESDIMTTTAPAKTVTTTTTKPMKAAPASKVAQPVTPAKPKAKAKVPAPIVDATSLLSQPKYVAPLVPEYTGKDGKVRKIGFMALTVANLFNWLRHNVGNRPINWGHLATLMHAWKTDWVDEANVYIMDFNEVVADGQHRPIAFILQFGSRQQVEDLLRLISTWPKADWTLPGEIDPAQPIGKYVPINGYALSNIGIESGRYLAVIYGASPRVADKADTDQRKRTGGDQLARHAESSNLLAKWGLKATEMQTMLRYMYLRVMPATEQAKSKGANYGSLRKGGNVHPDRYPVLAVNFQPFIEQAMEIVHGNDGFGYTQSRNGEVNKESATFVFDHNQLIGTIALAIQGNVSIDKIRAFLKSYLIPAGTEPAENTANGVLYRRNAKKTVIHSNMIAYLMSRYLQAKTGQNPTIAGTTQLQRETALVELLGGEGYEQQSGNRLNGWDSTGCAEIVSTALKNKLRAAELKAERAQQSA